MVFEGTVIIQTFLLEGACLGMALKINGKTSRRETVVIFGNIRQSLFVGVSLGAGVSLRDARRRSYRLDKDTPFSLGRRVHAVKQVKL